jgi:hypothetical protein
MAEPFRKELASDRAYATVFATVAALHFSQAVLIPLAIAICWRFNALVVTRLKRTLVGDGCPYYYGVIPVRWALGWVVERRLRRCRPCPITART